VFGLFGIDILIKSADGKILNDDLLDKLNNETIIVQNKNNSLENAVVQIQQETLPISQYVYFDNYLQFFFLRN